MKAAEDRSTARRMIGSILDAKSTSHTHRLDSRINPSQSPANGSWYATLTTP